jgi:hypothetical protein
VESAPRGLFKIHDKIDQVQDPRRLVSIFTVTRHVIIDYYRTSSPP